MIKINLIPPEYIANINRRAVIAKAILGVVLTLAVVVLLSGWQVTRSEAIKLNMARREAELKSLQGDVEKVQAIEAQIAEVQRYLDAINRIAKGRLAYTKFLQDIARGLPATIWFNSISTTLLGDTLTVSFAVNSRSAYDLAYWINALETNPDYSGVNLSGGITISEDESGKLFVTQLILKYACK
jgi:Tfp pilus assembly protein PilN